MNEPYYALGVFSANGYFISFIGNRVFANREDAEKLKDEVKHEFYDDALQVLCANEWEVTE